MSPENYVVFPSNPKSENRFVLVDGEDENRFVLVDGEDTASTDNITSSSTKFTIVSVEVTKEYERNSDSPKSPRPTNLRVDCSPPQKPKTSKTEKGSSTSSSSAPSPTYLNSPSFNMSDCSSPATTTTECWSPTCSCPGLSPTYSPGLCPEIMVTNVEVPSYGAIEESDKSVVQLGESIL